MMHEYHLTIGLNDKDEKIQVVKTSDAKNILANILLKEYGLYAYTMFECSGVYTHDDGTMVSENSLRIEIASDDELNIRAIATSIKNALNQESVMVKHTMSDIDFI